MEKKHKVMGIMGLVALRKSELFYKIVSELSKEKQISDEDKEKIKNYVAKMDNEQFLSNEEKKTKKINPELKLQDTDIDIEAVIKGIGI